MTDEIAIGVLGAGRGASVDPRGQLRPERAAWVLDWWVGADDRWHLATDEVAVRQTRLDGMPIVQTAMRVPGGDAVQSIYAAPAPVAGAAAVVEVANESPAPFVLALVVTGASTVDADGVTVFVDGRSALRSSRPASRWAMARGASTRDIVTSGGASDAPFAARRDRGAALVAAFLYPVAHRTTMRVAVALGTHGLGPVEPSALPPADAVSRGWRAQLDRGMRGRAAGACVASGARHRAGHHAARGSGVAGRPAVVAALEDWGFDGEAAEAWTRLTGRERRRLSGRGREASAWSEVRARSDRDPVGMLAALRDVLVRERESSIDLGSEWPPEWRGLPVDVRDAPTRSGPVSWSVRWHGERPALLWDGPAGVTFRAPGLDPTWSTVEPRGETLLGASGVDDAAGWRSPRTRGVVTP